MCSAKSIAAPGEQSVQRVKRTGTVALKAERTCNLRKHMNIGKTQAN